MRSGAGHEQAERVPGGVEVHPHVFLWLVRRQGGPARLSVRAGRVEIVGPQARRSRCIIICCSPGPAGHAGGTCPVLGLNDRPVPPPDGRSMTQSGSSATTPQPSRRR